MAEETRDGRTELLDKLVVERYRPSAPERRPLRPAPPAVDHLIGLLARMLGHDQTPHTGTGWPDDAQEAA